MADHADSAAHNETGVEIQRQFNELRHAVLDRRASTISWWLTVIAIVLTFFGIVVAVAGYFGYAKFQELEKEAQTYIKRMKETADHAQETVDRIVKLEAEGGSAIKEMRQLIGKERAAREAEIEGVRISTSEDADDPDKATRVEAAVQGVQRNPAASSLVSAIAQALALQRRGEIAEAIEKWRSIARVAVETDKQLAARAWYSVGYLLWDGQTEKSKAESAQEAISAYDKAIELKPDFHAAYVNRGVAKRRLGLLDEAIANYDKAIELKPDDYVAYNNRCFAKGAKDSFEEAIADCNKAATLRPSYPNTYSSRCYVYGQWDRFREAIADCDKAIRLKPDYHEAFYYRGIAKSGSDTDLKSEAREDLKTALQLARKANDTTIAEQANQALGRLSR